MAPRVHLLLSLILPFTVQAFVWPFGQKRFKANALIGAGALGLEDLNGRVAAFGDFDGDQFLDVLTLSEDQRTLTLYSWNHDQFTYSKSTTLSFSSDVANVVPGDFTHDGKLDLLVMKRSGSWSTGLDMEVYVGTSSGLSTSPISVPPSTSAQPIAIDANGDMKIDLLGISPSSSPPALQIWQNSWNPSSPSNSTLFTLTNPSFVGAQPCELADPHSSAVLDFDGDCLADLFLVCKSSDSNRLSYQIWLNDKSGSFVFSQGGQFPEGTGPISFADMDRDGTIDMVFPTCTSISSTTGVGTDCYINIAYNKQKPLCASSTPSGARNCRPPDDLCTSDPSFVFNLDESPSNDAFTRFPLKTLMGNMETERLGLLLFDTTYKPPLPLPLKIGDADLDGFPDLLLLVAHNGGLFGIATTPWLLQSVPCTGRIRKASGSNCPQNRRFYEPVTRHVEPLQEITDARGAAWLDIDEDGTLDILVQRTGSQVNQKVTFIQNNFFHDAFFLKAIVLNGACSNGICTPVNRNEPKYHPFGVSYSGATYKYTVLDTSGRRSAAQVPQLPQTGYHSLQTPYSFFGLGRTNNYIENLFVGSTKHSPKHFINMEGVIPNSKVVIIPSPNNEDGSWKRELYLRPGDWIPWVMLTTAIATVILGIIVFVLHLNEKREDEMERRRALHHINFDAL